MRLHTGKLGGFEGGIRVPAVVAGGWLPSVLRGASYSGLVHMADWYPTIAAAAGLPIRDHRSSLVAAVDGASMWYRWLRNATGDRTLVLGEELAITQTVRTRHTHDEAWQAQRARCASAGAHCGARGDASAPGVACIA